jgi:large subunit ribosomal protein L5
MSIGCKVTLRGGRMYEFVDKLFNAALPRVRDFRGVSAIHLTAGAIIRLGIKDQLIFPEIDYDKVDKVRGMDIVFVTTAQNGRGSQGAPQACWECRQAFSQESEGG